MARRYGGMAAFYEEMARPMDRAGVAVVRARLAGALRGRVLELGCGTGLNFAHYRPDAEVTAIEPLDEFRSFATARAKTVAARIHVQDGDAQALPFADHSFDGTLATLVFCSIPAASRGLQELRRVLRPGAPVRFFEHVRSERPRGALLQDICNPVWGWMMDGCNLNRDTVAAIRAAGFVIERVEVHDIRIPRAPHFPMREVHAHS
jgi:SAM-dependent methyltransferase